MTTTTMKNKLLERFSSFAIGQSIYLHTKRTTDIEELTAQELEEIYKLFFPKQPTVQEQLFDAKNNDVLKRHRSNILTIATRIGLKQPDSWEQFNNWMLKSSRYHKRLNDHNLEELKALEIQMRATEVNYERSALQPGTKAWFHKNKITPPSAN